MLAVSGETFESLELFSKILKKAPEKIVEEALERYFTNIQDEMVQKSLLDDNAQTNLSYDEFWDGVEL
ncbi:MAG: hypothetical protein L3J42_01985 [Hydrogenimonas sp.]|nr:hypothetical protein [Hydrogenimonas sp.]